MFGTAFLFWDIRNFTAALVFVCTFLLLFYNTRRRHGVPPGPALFPIIGNLPSLVGDNLFGTLNNLRVKYGNVFGLYIGTELTIFLNGYHDVHDALIKNGTRFVNRSVSSFSKQIIKHPLIIWGNGKRWKEYKTCLREILQELCFQNGGERIEGIIIKEVEFLVNELNTKTESLDISSYVSVSVANVVLRLAYKLRYDFKDEIILQILKDISDGAKDYAKLSVIVNCFPFLSHFPGDIFKIKAHDRKLKWVFANFRPSINDIIEDIDGNLDCIAGLYANRLEQMKEKGIYNSLTESDLDMLCYELLCAGSETTGTTLRWIILYLMKYPDIQAKMFQEIASEIGKDKLPALKDRKLLPYSQAVILEGMRIAPAAPLAIPHAVSNDLVFHGHSFPEKSSIIINLDSCLKDPSVWEDPEKFQPERFLNKAETEISIPKEFIPFSLGPRSCPGETISRIELFLYLTTLVQRFEFHPKCEDDIPDVNGEFGLTWSPRPFELKISKR